VIRPSQVSCLMGGEHCGLLGSHRRRTAPPCAGLAGPGRGHAPATGAYGPEDLTVSALPLRRAASTDRGRRTDEVIVVLVHSLRGFDGAWMVAKVGPRGCEMILGGVLSALHGKAIVDASSGGLCLVCRPGRSDWKASRPRRMRAAPIVSATG